MLSAANQSPNKDFSCCLSCGLVHPNRTHLGSSSMSFTVQMRRAFIKLKPFVPPPDLIDRSKVCEPLAESVNLILTKRDHTKCMLFFLFSTDILNKRLICLAHKTGKIADIIKITPFLTLCVDDPRLVFVL